ncbi:MAG: ATP-binding protein [Rhodospirillales bacterium]
MADLFMGAIPLLSIVIVLIALLYYGRKRDVFDRMGWTFLSSGVFLFLCAAVLQLTARDSLAPGIAIASLAGAVAVMVGIARLIRTAPADNRRPEAILEAAVEGMSEGILYFDADDRLVLVNGKIAEMYPLAKEVFVPGVSYETCLRKGVEVGQWGPTNGQGVEDWIQATLAKHFDPKGPVEFNLINGRVIRVEERRTRDGGIVGIRADVTELRAAQKEIQVQRDELAKLNTQKDRFFAIIAHDLRSPFSNLLGFSEVIRTQTKTLTPEQVSEYVSVVNRTAEQAYNLLVDLLDWSRLQLDRMDFEPEALDLEQVINQNMDQMLLMAGAKQISITREIDRALRVRADAQMVNTILRNLVDNAIKFTPDKGTVTVRAHRRDSFGLIEVTDTGVGMPSSKLEQLFRLDMKTSTKGTRGETGTGLGLQLCKEMVERLGGELMVESTQGQGTSFRFTLPLVAA